MICCCLSIFAIGNILQGSIFSPCHSFLGIYLGNSAEHSFPEWLLTIKRFVLACCLILSKALSQSNSISSKMRGKLWLWLLSIPLPFHIPALQTFSPSQQSLEWQAFNYLLGRMLHCNHIFSSGNDILFFVCHFIDPPQIENGPHY